MFASLADGESLISNYSSAADPQSTLQCLRQLGVKWEQSDGVVKIIGVGRDGYINPDSPLDCGNSGTTMRLMGGILAGAGVHCEMIGDESLSARTMKRIIDPLTEMGCNIDGRDGKFAPLKIRGHNGVKGLRYPLPIASAQLKSAVLLAGLFGEEPTEVFEKEQSRDHTERLLGLKSVVHQGGKLISGSRKDKIPIQSYRVPGDFSAAAFWLVAGSIHRDSDLLLKSVGMNPTRTAAMTILEQMGGEFKKTNQKEEGREPVADIHVSPCELKGVTVDPLLIPNCIDELPILMVAMCFAEGKSVISGAEELRHKETDRLSAMAKILKNSGADIEEKPDGMVINGRPNFIPNPTTYPTWRDHRMAMAAAVMASRSNGKSQIQDAECTAISYPNFWDHLYGLS
tara:strand:+ start:22215 stop:23414 length:1200 start_codon:yes stop_codon:yes gene_type:complete